MAVAKHACAALVVGLASVPGGAAAYGSAQDPPPAPAPAREPDLDDDDEEEPDPRFWSLEDGWLDVSGFLDEKYGFLPVVLPITEPAVGYGAAVGLAFIGSPLSDAKAGYGRPDITVVGGMGTENGSWGALAADVRYWLDDRLQTVVGVVDASVNLDFHGIGEQSPLEHDPLEYALDPLGGLVQAKARLGDSRWWGGLGYAFATTTVEFEGPDDAPTIPDFSKRTDVGGLLAMLTFDSRDNTFTPTQGTYFEVHLGAFSSAFGGDDEFERLTITMLHYLPIAPTLFLGVRADVSAAFGDEPFYLDPYVSLRGVPVMRYQGEEVAQSEVELRWQCFERFSLVGFGGAGVAWNDLERVDDANAVISGGAGFRYELARRYGIHAGVDVAFSADDAAVYLQIGSAWARP
jgi:hypothetical protein